MELDYRPDYSSDYSSDYRVDYLPDYSSYYRPLELTETDETDEHTHYCYAFKEWFEKCLD